MNQLNQLSDWPLYPYYLMVGEGKCVADWNGATFSEIIKCGTNTGHQRGRRTGELNINIPCSNPPDFIFTWGSDCVVQKPVLSILKDHKITGFETRNARAILKKSRETLDVAELIVTGWGGMVAEASGIREVERCAECGHIRYSGISDSTQIVTSVNWDGSDVFMIWPMPLYRFVTQRFVDIVKGFGFTGISFSQKFPELPRGVVSGFTPGRLSYFMSEDRAHLLGDTLDIV